MVNIFNRTVMIFLLTVIFLEVGLLGKVGAAPLYSLEEYKSFLATSLDDLVLNMLETGNLVEVTREQLINELRSRSRLVKALNYIQNGVLDIDGLSRASPLHLLALFEKDYPNVPLLVEIPAKFGKATFYARFITSIPSNVKGSALARMCKVPSGSKRFIWLARGSGVIVLSLGINAAVSKKVAADYPDWAKHKAPPSARKGIGNHAGAGP